MEEDRISQLCDDILLLILDKIDTSQAVKTTILSNRWKNLWCSLPSLRLHLSLAADLNFEDFYFPTKLVYQLLSHRAAAAVRDFHLSYDGHLPYPKFDNKVHRKFTEVCLLYAINHGVQSLRLHWPSDRKPRLPAAFLACDTLRELELRNLSVPFKVPGRLSLPNLKTFHLQTRLRFDDDHDQMDPFSGLPELEKLTLVESFDRPFVIKSPKLRVLEIEDYCFNLKEISAPSLTSFRYQYGVAWTCSKVNLPMLEQVHIDLHWIGPILHDIHDNFGMMFHQFGNATIVSLTLDTLQILSCLFDSFEQIPPPFPNIKILKVMEGRYRIRTVLQRVIDHLTRSSNCEVELSPGLSIGEEMSDEDNHILGELVLPCI